MVGPPDRSSLWGYFDSVRFRTATKSLKPALIIDQFEELFTAYPNHRRDIFIDQLSDLLTGRVPSAERDRALEELDKTADEDPKRERLLDLAYGHSSVDVKILLAIREDHLAQLDAIKDKAPSLFRHSMRLESLSRGQAEQAIVQPARQRSVLGDGTVTFERSAITSILDFLSNQGVKGTIARSDDIETVHLQILCRNLFDRITTRDRAATSAADFAGAKGIGSLQFFYYKTSFWLQEFYRRLVDRLTPSELSRSARGMISRADLAGANGAGRILRFYYYGLRIQVQRLYSRLTQSTPDELKSSALEVAITKGMEQILRQHYYRTLRRIPLVRLGWNARGIHPSLTNLWAFNLPRYAARSLCEGGLILPSGYRNQLEGGYIGTTFGVPPRDLSKLVEQHLLRGDDRRRGRFYELLSRLPHQRSSD